MRPPLRRSARVLACTAAAVGGWHLLNHGWRSFEAAMVAGAATIGPGTVHWSGGDQIRVSGSAAPFVVVIGPLCSSIGPVLAALAIGAAFARTVAAVRAVAFAAAVLFVGNFVRMVAVVVIGARHGAADLEVAHDGWATWFAVAFVLIAAAILAAALRRDQRPAAASPAGEATSR